MDCCTYHKTGGNTQKDATLVAEEERNATLECKPERLACSGPQFCACDKCEQLRKLRREEAQQGTQLELRLF
jgi:hypothetical protein